MDNLSVNIFRSTGYPQKNNPIRHCLRTDVRPYRPEAGMSTAALAEQLLVFFSFGVPENLRILRISEANHGRKDEKMGPI